MSSERKRAEAALAEETRGSLPLSVVHRTDGSEERSHPAAEVPAVRPSAPTDLRRLTLLVVDDEPDARELLRRVLEDCGARVLTVAGVEEALTLAKTERPHLVITDIGMPDADGYDLLRRRRALAPRLGGEIPAIALTAFARSEDRTRVLGAGFRMHISKPVEPAELCIAVADAVGRTGGRNGD